LSLGVRYTGDFSQVYKDGQSATLKATPTGNFLANNPSVHNSVFQFQVGYAFGGK
jgi:hypothetical protein